jgi:hypothetical protein
MSTSTFRSGAADAQNRRQDFRDKAVVASCLCLLYSCISIRRNFSTLACIHLGGEDVALAIDGDVVKRRETCPFGVRPTEAAERLLRGAVDDDRGRGSP